MAHSCALFQRLDLSDRCSLAQRVSCPPLFLTLPWSAHCKWFDPEVQKAEVSCLKVRQTVGVISAPEFYVGSGRGFPAELTSLPNSFLCLILFPLLPFSWEYSPNESHTSRTQALFYQKCVGIPIQTLLLNCVFSIFLCLPIW